MLAGVEAAYEATGVARTEEQTEHLVTTPDDAHVEEAKAWVEGLAKSLAEVASATSAAGASASASAGHKAQFAKSVSLMAQEQDPMHQLSLNEMAELAPAIAEAADQAMPVLLERVQDVQGYLAAISEAIAAREAKRRLASASAKAHANHVKSKAAGEAHAAAKAETHGKVDETLGVTSGSDGNYGLSAEQLKNATDVFGMFDQSGDGQISASELGSAFEAMGKKLTSAELNTMLQKVDTDGSGEISYSEFLSLVGPMIKKGGLVDSQQIMAASVDSFGELGEVVSTQVCVCVYRDDALAARARALSLTTTTTTAPTSHHCDASAAPPPRASFARAQATVLALNAQAAGHALMVQYHSSDQDVVDAEAAMLDQQAEFELVNARLVAEVDEFKATCVERLRAVLMTYFMVEFNGCAREHKLLEEVILRLDGDLKEIKKSIGM